MTPTELKSYRTTLGLSAERFARAVNVSGGRTVRKWEKGDRDIPGPVIRLMELATDFPRVRDWLIKKSLSDEKTS